MPPALTIRKDSMLHSLKTTPSQVTQTDVAYLAGLIDGEGSIYIYRRKAPKGKFGYILNLAIGMCDSEVIHWIQDTFGGHVQDNIRTAGRNQFRWTVSSEAVAKILRMVSPFLRVKKRQAALAFKFREIIKQDISANSVRVELRDKLIEELQGLNMRKGGSARRRDCTRGSVTEESPEMIQSALQGNLQDFPGDGEVN